MTSWHEWRSVENGELYCPDAELLVYPDDPKAGEPLRCPGCGKTACVFPRCRDRGGQPRFTHACICDRCRDRYRTLLHDLALDYVRLRTEMPSPVRRGEPVRGGSRTWGHPREWASDAAANIADILTWVEDDLRDHLGLEPPPWGSGEARRVAHAHNTLTARFNALCTYPGAKDSAVELTDLHGRIFGTLGEIQPASDARLLQWLPLPCPGCDVKALTREVRAYLPTRIECKSCRDVVPEERYGLLTRIALHNHIDNLINGYDNREGVA